MFEYFLYVGVISDRSSLLLESDVDARVCDFIQLEQVIEDIANFGFGLYFHDDLLDSGVIAVGAAHYHHAHLIHALKLLLTQHSSRCNRLRNSYLLLCANHSFEVYLEDFPLLCEKLSLGVPRKRETRFRRANVLAVVVADREFSVGPLLVPVVDDADVAAAEDGSFVGVVGDGELGQV